jgi:hypothetical protein
MNTESTVQELAVKVEGMIEGLPESAKVHELTAKLNEVIAHLNKMPKARDRGPESSRTMVEEDAKRICLGDLATLSHTKAAEALGLSYGQVYSARKGFTFKAVYKEAVKAGKIRD